MAELTSRTQANANIGDTFEGDEITYIYDAANGFYAWIKIDTATTLPANAIDKVTDKASDTDIDNSVADKYVDAEHLKTQLDKIKDSAAEWKPSTDYTVEENLFRFTPTQATAIGKDSDGSNVNLTQGKTYFGKYIIPKTSTATLTIAEIALIEIVANPSLPDLSTKEDLLGNPTTNGQILSSQIDGTRSWIDAPNPTTDAVPTDGSTNPVQSNGVFDALALKADKTELHLDDDVETVTGTAVDITDPRNPVINIIPPDIATDADITAKTASKLLDASHIIDEDDFASDSDVKVPTQQSAHAYIDRRDAFLDGLGVIRRGMQLRFITGNSQNVLMDMGTFLDWNPVTHQDDPHPITTQNPLTFGYLLSDGTVPTLTGIADASNTNVVVNGEREDEATGNVISVTSGRELAHRVFVNPLTEDVKILLAQHEWNTSAEVVQKIGQEIVVIPAALATYEMIGAIVVPQNSTNYFDSNNSAILMASESGRQFVSGGAVSVNSPSYLSVGDDTARDALTTELIQGLTVAVLNSAENGGVYAEYRVVSPAATWATSTTELVYPESATEIPDSTIPSTDGSYSNFGTLSVERLDQWGVSRRVRRIFNVSTSFDMTALNYADKTAIWVRNISSSTGLNLIYGTGGTNTLHLTQANGFTSAPLAGSDSFNIQPLEIAVMEKDGTDVYVSVFPSERVSYFNDYNAANLANPIAHDGLVIIRSTGEIFGRKTNLDGIAFPANGQPDANWFRVGSSGGGITEISLFTNDLISANENVTTDYTNLTEDLFFSRIFSLGSNTLTFGTQNFGSGANERPRYHRIFFNSNSGDNTISFVGSNLYQYGTQTVHPDINIPNGENVTIEIMSVEGFSGSGFVRVLSGQNTETTSTYTGLQLVGEAIPLNDSESSSATRFVPEANPPYLSAQPDIWCYWTPATPIDFDICDEIKISFANSASNSIKYASIPVKEIKARINSGQFTDIGIGQYNNAYLRVRCDSIADLQIGKLAFAANTGELRVFRIQGLANATNGYVVPTATVSKSQISVQVNGGANVVAPTQLLEGAGAAALIVDLPAGQMIDAGAFEAQVLPTGVTAVVRDAEAGTIAIEVAEGTGNVDLTVPFVAAPASSPKLYFVDVFEDVRSGASVTKSFTPIESGVHTFIVNCGYQTVSNYGMNIGTTSGGQEIYNGALDRLNYGPKKYEITLNAGQLTYITWWGGGSAPSRAISLNIYR